MKKLHYSSLNMIAAEIAQRRNQQGKNNISEETLLNREQYNPHYTDWQY